MKLEDENMNFNLKIVDSEILIFTRAKGKDKLREWNIQ